MRKTLLLIILILSLAITGCGNEEADEAENQDPAPVEQTEDEEVREIDDQDEIEDTEPEEVESSEDKNLKTVEEYREMLKGDVGEGETIENIELVNNNIIITVDLGEEHKLFSQEELAENRYSSITDTLLDEGGNLNDITVKFTNLGKITMNTSEKESNEYGDYFDSFDIQENFQYE